MPLNDVVIQLVLTGFLGVLVGVLGWRSIIAIKKNAREIAQGPTPAEFERLREMVEEMREETHMLRAELDEQRAHTGDIHERLDFAERMLTQVREKQPLPPGPGS